MKPSKPTDPAPGGILAALLALSPLLTGCMSERPLPPGTGRKLSDRPPSVSPERIRMGGEIPPDGASVLKFLDRKLSEAEGGPAPSSSTSAPSSKPAGEQESPSGGQPSSPPSDADAPPRPTPSSSAQVPAVPPDEPTALRWLSSGSWAKRAAACRFFSETPSPKAFRGLARNALSGTPAAPFAFDALVSLGGEAAARALYRAALENPLPANRALAARALCRRMGFEADEFILPLAEKGDVLTRPEAVRAAGTRRLPRAPEVLERILRDTSLPTRTRLAAAGALLRLRPGSRQARTLLYDALGRGGPSAFEALRILSETPGDWPARVLAGALLANDPRLARLALSGLLLRHPDETLRALREAFAPPADGDERVRLARALAMSFRDPAALERLLRSEDPSDRLLALSAARYLGLASLETDIRRMAGNDPVPQVRDAAGETLRTLSGKAPEGPGRASWSPRFAERVYTAPDGRFLGAFITGDSGEERFFPPGARLPDGSILEEFTGKALRIKRRDGTALEIPVHPSAVKTPGNNG